MLGVKAYRSQPEDLAEFVRICGDERTAMEYGDSEAYFRGFAPKVRKLFLDKIVKATGIAVAVTGTKPATPLPSPSATDATLAGLSPAHLAPLPQLVNNVA